MTKKIRFLTTSGLWGKWHQYNKMIVPDDVMAIEIREYLTIKEANQKYSLNLRRN